jgi:hypothetical protein
VAHSGFHVCVCVCARHPCVCVCVLGAAGGTAAVAHDALRWLLWPSHVSIRDGPHSGPPPAASRSRPAPGKPTAQRQEDRAGLHSLLPTSEHWLHACIDSARWALQAGAHWPPPLWRQTGYRPLGEIRVAILGMGSIGREVAKACQALGMQVAGLVRRIPPSAPQGTGVGWPVSPTERVLTRLAFRGRAGIHHVLGRSLDGA